MADVPFSVTAMHPEVTHAMSVFHHFRPERRRHQPEKRTFHYGDAGWVPGMAGIAKGFGRGQAYESLRWRNPRAAGGELWGFRFLADFGGCAAAAEERLMRCAGTAFDGDRWRSKACMVAARTREGLDFGALGKRIC